MKYSNLTWGLIAVMAVLMVAAVGQNMGLFSLVAPSGYVWNDNDVLNDVGTAVAPLSYTVNTVLYTNTFTTTDDMIRVSTLPNAKSSRGYTYGEYSIVITDGIINVNSGLFGAHNTIVNWYADISELDHTKTKITVIGRRAQRSSYQNGGRYGTCSGDLCPSYSIKLAKIGISSNKNEPPVVDYSINPSPVVEGAGSIFDASESYSPLNSPLTYSWNMGDGTLLTGDVLTHTYDTAGSYVVTLTVDDGLMSSTKKDIIKVERFGYIAPPQCPTYAPPYCPDGVLIAQPATPDGCSAPPICVIPDDPPVDDVLPSEPPVDDGVTSIPSSMLMVLGGIFVFGIVAILYIKRK